MSGERDQIKIKINGKDKHINVNDKSNRKEIAAGVNKEDEFEWVLPDYNNKPQIYYDAEKEENETYYSPRINPNYYKKKGKFGTHKQPNIKKPQFKMMIPKGVLISIISAIVVGVGLGFLVLLVFTDDDKSDLPISNTAPVTNSSNKEDNKAKATASFGMDFSIVQGGVYSTTEKASTAAEELKQQDIPAVVDEMDGKFNILIGIAENTQTAEQIESAYKANNIDAYAKPWSYKIENVSLPASVDKDWFVKGEELLKGLITASGNAYSDSLVAEDLHDLKESFKAWSKNKPDKASKEIADKLDFYEKALDAGIKSLTAENKMDTQQKTLNAYMAFKSIIAELNK